MQERHDTRHHMSPAQHLLPKLHKLRDRVSPIPNPLLELRGDEGSSFRLIEPQPSREAFLRQEAGLDG